MPAIPSISSVIPPSDAKLAYSIADAVLVTGLSRASIYRAIGDGRLQPRKNGRATLLLRSDLEQFLADLPRGVDPRETAHGKRMIAARYSKEAGRCASGRP